MINYLDNRIQSTDRIRPVQDSVTTEMNITHQSGGVGVDADQVNIGNDAVGRDKIESAGGHIVHAGPGAIVIINEPSGASEVVQNRQGPGAAETTSNAQIGRDRSTSPQSAEMMFDCGHRVRQVREEIGLTTSQFAEEVRYGSAKAFEQMEQRQLECSESVLQRVSDFSGVSLEWLKHGKGKKYPPTDFPFYPLDQAIEMIPLANSARRLKRVRVRSKVARRPTCAFLPTVC